MNEAHTEAHARLPSFFYVLKKKRSAALITPKAFLFHAAASARVPGCTGTLGECSYHTELTPTQLCVCVCVHEGQNDVSLKHQHWEIHKRKKSLSSVVVLMIADESGTKHWLQQTVYNMNHNTAHSTLTHRHSLPVDRPACGADVFLLKTSGTSYQGWIDPILRIGTSLILVRNFKINHWKERNL